MYSRCLLHYNTPKIPTGCTYVSVTICGLFNHPSNKRISFCLLTRLIDQKNSWKIKFVVSELHKYLKRNSGRWNVFLFFQVNFEILSQSAFLKLWFMMVMFALELPTFQPHFQQIYLPWISNFVRPIYLLRYVTNYEGIGK